MNARPSPSSRHGLLLAGSGVLAFSLTLPATRLAVQDLDPYVVAFGRALIAAGLASVVLAATRSPLPAPGQVRRLALVALGVVIGFPLFTSLALVTQTSAHGAVVVGLLPLATALWAVTRADERPSLGFWMSAGFGALAVIGFAVAEGARGIGAGDLLLLAAVVLGRLGYAKAAP